MLLTNGMVAITEIALVVCTKDKQIITTANTGSRIMDFFNMNRLLHPPQVLGYRSQHDDLSKDL